MDGMRGYGGMILLVVRIPVPLLICRGSGGRWVDFELQNVSIL